MQMYQGVLEVSDLDFTASPKNVWKDVRDQKKIAF